MTLNQTLQSKCQYACLKFIPLVNLAKFGKHPRMSMSLWPDMNAQYVNSGIVLSACYDF